MTKTKEFVFWMFIFTILLMLNANNIQAAIVLTKSASRITDRGIRACGQKFKGQIANLNNCVSDNLQKLSQELKTPDIPTVAPQAASIVASAAAQLRNKRTKEAAAAVLNKTRLVLRALTSKSSGQTRRVYDRLSRVFNVAISVIKNKG